MSNNMVIFGGAFNILLQIVVYQLGAGSTSTGAHPFDM